MPHRPLASHDATTSHHHVALPQLPQTHFFGIALSTSCSLIYLTHHCLWQLQLPASIPKFQSALLSSFSFIKLQNLTWHWYKCCESVIDWLCFCFFFLFFLLRMIVGISDFLFYFIYFILVFFFGQRMTVNWIWKCDCVWGLGISVCLRDFFFCVQLMSGRVWVEKVRCELWFIYSFC